MGERALTVVRCGLPVLVQDLGRPGLAAVGVGTAGAADLGAHRLAQRLLANPESAAGLEVTLGGLELEVHGEVTLALTGAPAPATLEGRPVAYATPLRAGDGARLVLGAPSQGVRSYVAVRGGVACEAVLGSRSHDTLSALGPPPLNDGDRVPVGPPPQQWPAVDLAPVRALPEVIEVDADPGPREDWFDRPAALVETLWSVSADSDRIGVRLTGSILERHPDRSEAELPSEGVVTGAVQVPPGGEPVVFHADHPVTGGYPVLAVLRRPGLDALAQARPGQRVRIRVHR